MGILDLSKGRAARFMFAAFCGVAAGVATAIAILVVGAGVFWLYLFGDDPWPAHAETALAIGAYTAGTLVFVSVTYLSMRSR